MVRRVLFKLAEQDKWPAGWAADWAKSLYAPTAMFGASSSAAPYEASGETDREGWCLGGMM
jgi:hypothetical protein